jgi:hypothetical protein
MGLVCELHTCGIVPRELIAFDVSEVYLTAVDFLIFVLDLFKIGLWTGMK